VTIPEEKYFLAQLAQCSPCDDFQHLIIGGKIGVTAVLIPQVLLTYVVPENSTLIITRLGFRSIPVPNDASLTVGDWRSDDFDASGKAQAFISVNGTPATTTIASTFLLFNRPVLFCFKAGVTVTVSVVRFAADPPPTFVAELALNCYLASPNMFDLLSNNITVIDAQYS
jgi:hypothetical protein